MLKDTHMVSHMRAHTQTCASDRTPQCTPTHNLFSLLWLPKSPGMAKKNKTARRKIAQGLEGSMAPAERKRTESVVR